jgi:hypothetical protein
MAKLAAATPWDSTVTTETGRFFRVLILCTLSTATAMCLHWKNTMLGMYSDILIFNICPAPPLINACRSFVWLLQVLLLLGGGTA